MMVFLQIKNGSFIINTDLKGQQVLIISFIGYQQYEKELDLKGEEIILEVILKEEQSELYAVVITAGAFEASDEKKAVVLRPLDIVTTAGGQADVYSVMNTLPGTQKVGEQGELFVRGGESYETKTYIDGMIVQSPYFSSMPDVPSRGRFSPFLFTGTIFSSGGYSAEYGQALSSALILKTSDLPENTQSSLSFMSIGLSGSHTQRWKKTSMSVEGGYTNLTPYFRLINQDLDWDKGPGGYGGSANMRHKIGKDGLMKLYCSYSTGESKLNYSNIDNLSSKLNIRNSNDNLYFNGTYRDIINEKWSLRGGVSYTNDIEINDISNDEISTSLNAMEAKICLTNIISDHANIKFGGNIINRRYNLDFYESFSNIIYSSDVNDDLSAMFVETELRVNSKFATRIGGRFEYSSILDKANLAPRISLAYKTSKYSQVSMAYGHFFQSPKDDYLRYNPSMEFEKATHYIANFQIMKKKQTFRIEVYYKEYDELVKFDSLYSPVPSSYNNRGNGYAKGLDVFWRNKNIGNLDYWISYSYIDTKRDYKDYPESSTPTFISDHNLSIVSKYYVSRITSQIGLTYSYSSGRPYYNPNNEEFHSDRTSDYHDLSFNISYLTEIKDHFTIVFFSVSNLPGFDNVFGYRYSRQPNDFGTYDSIAIKPAAKRFLFLGIFISFEKSKKQSI